jgi:hypothetical protein
MIACQGGDIPGAVNAQVHPHDSLVVKSEEQLFADRLHIQHRMTGDEAGAFLKSALGGGSLNNLTLEEASK